MTVHLAAFYGLAILLVGTAIGMIASRNTVHAVLLMAANFLLTAGVYLLLHAPFLALVQVIVYAGAIMVLFLFVVMLMGPADVGLAERIRWQRPLALASCVAVGGVVVSTVLRHSATAPGAHLARDLAAGAGALQSGAAAAPAVDAAFGSPAGVGRALFTAHVLPFEVVSILLLVAMLGAVVLTRGADR